MYSFFVNNLAAMSSSRSDYVTMFMCVFCILLHTFAYFLHTFIYFCILCIPCIHIQKFFQNDSKEFVSLSVVKMFVRIEVITATRALGELVVDDLT